MRNKGFTLVELLVVIFILGIITTIGVVSINGISNTIKNNILETKLEIIEKAAVMKGQDVRGSIINSSLSYNGSPCKSFIVSDLVPDYLDKDNENECLNQDSMLVSGCVINPNNEYEYLDLYEVIVYYKNKKIHAKVDYEENLNCS